MAGRSGHDALSAATPNRVFLVEGVLARFWTGEYAVPLASLTDAVTAARG